MTLTKFKTRLKVFLRLVYYYFYYYDRNSGRHHKKIKIKTTDNISLLMLLAADNLCIINRKTHHHDIRLSYPTTSINISISLLLLLPSFIILTMNDEGGPPVFVFRNMVACHNNCASSK